jgi:flagellar basal-body rod protein FlgC
MIPAIDASTLALRAFQKKLNTTGNNIANVNTDEFKRDRATLSEGDHGGVKVNIDKDETPGIPVERSRDGRTVATETSNVDLAEEITETIPTQRGFAANTKVVQTKDEMLGTLLDIIG